MPCWTRTTVKIDVSKWNQDRAQQALKEVTAERTDFYEAYFELGVLVIRSSSARVNQEIKTAITQKYAALTLKTAAKRFGWQVKSEINNQIHLTRS